MSTYTHWAYAPSDLTDNLSALLAGITPPNILGSQVISELGSFRLTIQSIAPYTTDITGSSLPTTGSTGAPDFTGTINVMRFKVNGAPPSSPSFTLDLGDTPMASADFMANPLSIFDGNDTFIGGLVANTFYHYGGDDTFDGGNSINNMILDDTLYGGDGNDTFIIREQTDATKYNPVIFGDDGIDTMTIDWVNVGPNAFLRMSRYTVAPSSIERLSFSYVAIENGVEVTRDAYVFGRSHGTLFNGPDLTAIHGVGRVFAGSVDLSGVDVTTLNASFTLFGGNLSADNLIGARSFGANTTEISYFEYAGNDTLGGGASTAIGSLFGEADNDTYIVGTGDVIVEAANQGTDTVQTTVTFSLAPKANLENLTLLGAADIDGTGNAVANRLTGNAAVNTQTGGAGDDTYVVGAGDMVVEAALGGDDVLLSSVTVTLGANVENLLLTGAAAINGFGDAVDNSLVGNTVANTLNGGGGADFMFGQRGNDTYYVDNAGDVVVELAGDTADVLRTSVNFTLAAGVSIETLGAAAGVLNIDLIGNALAQTIIGNGGGERHQRPFWGRYAVRRIRGGYVCIQRGTDLDRHGRHHRFLARKGYHPFAECRPYRAGRHDRRAGQWRVQGEHHRPFGRYG